MSFEMLTFKMILGWFSMEMLTTSENAHLLAFWFTQYTIKTTFTNGKRNHVVDHSQQMVIIGAGLP